MRLEGGQAADMTEASIDFEWLYSPFERLDVAMRDGTVLRAYEKGPAGAARIVMVNPIGVPILIASRLAIELSETYRVICWEQRGYGTPVLDFFSAPHDFSTFVDDLVDMIEHAGGAPYALIGICSGAALITRAVASGMVEASRLVFVSPSLCFQSGYVPSLFDHAFVPYMRTISDGDESVARELLEMRAAGLSERRAPDSIDDEAVAKAADTASLRSYETLSVYAASVREFTDQMLDTDIEQLHQHVELFCAADDQTVSIETVRRLCELLPDARLTERRSGGHYMVYLHEDVRVWIREALKRDRLDVDARRDLGLMENERAHEPGLDEL